VAFTPRYTITDSIASALTKIERARGFLDAADLSEDWLGKRRERAVLLEAHHSTHIEGTRLSLEDSERLLAGESVPDVDREDALELTNYREAFQLVAGYVAKREPITEETIREIHRRLVRDVRGKSGKPGEYRFVQNYIADLKTMKTVYVPPPPEDVPGMMRDLLEWLRDDRKTHPVLLAGIAQFQLVHIHPFLDGNGRTARLLSMLCLYRAGYDFKRLFVLSEFYDRDRPAYYRALQEVRERGMDLTVWLEYFTGGLVTQLREVQDRGERAIRSEGLLTKAHRAGLKDRAVNLLAFLLDRGKGTIAECEKALLENRRSLQRDLRSLVESGYLREVATSTTDPTKYYVPAL
jgi:Fic family protein